MNVLEACPVERDAVLIVVVIQFGSFPVEHTSMYIRLLMKSKPTRKTARLGRQADLSTT